jgi:phosphoribosylformylglycinamidine synthase
MPAVRIVIMLKPGVLDAAGQAVQRGLDALGFAVNAVRVGKVIEIDASRATREAVDDMCTRFLANPLIETWRIEEVPSAGEVPAGVVPAGTGGDA